MEQSYTTIYDQYIHLQSFKIMFESLGSLHKPKRSFNLIHLQSNEVYFLSLKCSMLVSSNHQEIKGKLHLCSRSIFFEPKSIDKPLVRMKFSSNIFLRLLKNIDNQKLKNLVNLPGGETETKNLVNKGIAYMTEILEKEPTNTHQNKIRNTLLYKLFEPSQSNQPFGAEKINTCLLVKLQRVFILYRWPMSPYITEKTDDNFVFNIYKSNPKQQLLRFLKIYDGLIQVDDEMRFVKSLIEATQEEGLTQFREIQEKQSHQVKFSHKARRVTIEGVSYGVFGATKDKLYFYPIVNAPDRETIQISLRDVKYIMRYRYMFRDIGIEFYLYNQRESLLLVFEDKGTREMIVKYLKQHCEKLLKIDMSKIVGKWINGEISNYQYLCFLNFQGNRSFNDLSQYPVFPWVIHDYGNEFDLNNPELYRDLSKPMGAINKTRLQQLKENYNIELKDKTMTDPACIYPTHYSTPGYVVYYLIRKIPEFVIKLQSGVFSPSDRIFRSVEQTYYNSLKLPSDFKQLTPEFYSNEFDFLVNNQKLELGKSPQGEPNDDVVLPGWASNAQDFLLKMRAALQSDYVSSHLNRWIDLIFGFKQTGTNAIAADNLYYHMTYEENVNMEKMMPPQQRVSIEVQISEFGQTPVTLFGQAHPTKKARILRIGEAQGGEEKGVLSAKVKLLTEENQKLRDEMEHQRYRFNRKLTEKEQLLIKSQKQKRKQIQQLKEVIGIDSNSLSKLHVPKEKFTSQREKEQYIKQLQELVKHHERQNEKYRVLVDGLTRQVNKDQSIISEIEAVDVPDDFLA